MTSEPDKSDVTVFAVFGLYQDRMVPSMITATDVADARRQYHAMYPGWAGTTLAVKSLEDLIEFAEVPDA